MNREFWLERWKNQKIGFHQDHINPYLIKYWPILDSGKMNRVFVPLCGKSTDLVWLMQQGCDVVGIELSQQAVEEFFSEHELEYEVSITDKLNVYTSNNITLYQGDFFDLTKAVLGSVSAVFDRAALIALPETMRAAYCQHLKALVGTAEMILISMEYDQDVMQGPPFSVPEQEILNHYSVDSLMQKLETTDLLKESSQFNQSGLDKMDENVFKISLSRNINNNA